MGREGGVRGVGGSREGGSVNVCLDTMALVYGNQWAMTV